MFNIDDKVRLKDYNGYIDHRQHKNEVAIIDEIGTFGCLGSIVIKWAKGDRSITSTDNLINLTDKHYDLFGNII